MRLLRVVYETILIYTGFLRAWLILQQFSKKKNMVLKFTVRMCIIFPMKTLPIIIGYGLMDMAFYER